MGFCNDNDSDLVGAPDFVSNVEKILKKNINPAATYHQLKSLIWNFKVKVCL